MKGKSVALLVLALGCGLVASLGITRSAGQRGDSASADTAPVYVAKTDIAGGIPITQELVKLEQWPKDRLPTGALGRQEELDGRRTRHKIYAGEPIIEPKLLARGQVPTDGMVPKGFRVVPVPVSLEAIHSGLVLPGTRCDLQVLIRADASMGVSETICKTILQNIRVFAVNNVTNVESQDPKTPDTRSILGKTVSLLVTPEQAQAVSLASQLGTIRLILRSGEDNDNAKVADMTFGQMMGFRSGGNRAKEDPLKEQEKRFQTWMAMIRKTLEQKAKAAPAAEGPDPQRFVMRVRLGTDVNDVLLSANSGVRGMPGDEGAWTATGMGSGPRAKASSAAPASKPAEAGPAPARGSRAVERKATIRASGSPEKELKDERTKDRDGPTIDHPGSCHGPTRPGPADGLGTIARCHSTRRRCALCRAARGRFQPGRPVLQGHGG